MTVEATFDQFCGFVRETALLRSVQEVLEWDERTQLPVSAGEHRAEQITYLAGMIHRRQTDSRLHDWLVELGDSSLAEDRHSDSATTIRQVRREYDKLVRVPQTLVEELSRVSVLGQQAWVRARKDDNFQILQPLLEQMIKLKQEQAAAVGFSECAYDPLLDDYEPGTSTAHVAQVLEALRQGLVPLVGAIADSGRSPNLQVVRNKYPIGDQEDFGRQAAEAIGFDFDRGRLDVTQHPFCCGLGPNDCRITTRYDEQFLPSALFSILHEAGHGIYEQGLRRDQYGLPPGTFVSLGIHESQSRLWENLVGRSRAFWHYFYPLAQQRFASALGQVPLDEFYFAINDVRSSLIRVEADEATYNLHIIIRFELEQALISGDLQVVDLPGAWSDKYREYLGIASDNDADGVLQDIHWSAALIGYFPTYSLGNLYASQFFSQAEQDIGPLAEQFQRGEFRPLLEWLQTKIHHPGQCYTAAELVEQVTGQPLSHEPALGYLRAKYEPLYGLD